MDELNAQTYRAADGAQQGGRDVGLQRARGTHERQSGRPARGAVSGCLKCWFPSRESFEIDRGGSARAGHYQQR